MKSFRISFLASVMVLLVLAMMFSAVPSANVFAQGGTPTGTPEVEPTPVQCPGTQVSRLVEGTLARVIPIAPNNAPNVFKREPSRNARTIDLLKANDEVLVLDGPFCAERLAWFKVEWKGLEGWTPEGDATTYWMEPVDLLSNAELSGTPGADSVCRGSLPTRLEKGMLAQIAAVPPRNLPNVFKVRPGVRERGIDLLNPGQEVFILDGPRCADNLTWWQVDWKGITGWTPEADLRNYWLEPKN